MSKYACVRVEYEKEWNEGAKKNRVKLNCEISCGRVRCLHQATGL